jgi:hypothetical protein
VQKNVGKILNKKVKYSWALVAHTPIILATEDHEDQEDCGSKPAWANSYTRPYLEKTLHKKGLVEWLKV